MPPWPKIFLLNMLACRSGRGQNAIPEYLAEIYLEMGHAQGMPNLKRYLDKYSGELILAPAELKCKEYIPNNISDVMPCPETEMQTKDIPNINIFTINREN
jgi:hypothetical protein